MTQGHSCVTQGRGHVCQVLVLGEKQLEATERQRVTQAAAAADAAAGIVQAWHLPDKDAAIITLAPASAI